MARPRVTRLGELVVDVPMTFYARYLERGEPRMRLLVKLSRSVRLGLNEEEARIVLADARLHSPAATRNLEAGFEVAGWDC